MLWGKLNWKEVSEMNFGGEILNRVVKEDLN